MPSLRITLPCAIVVLAATVCGCTTPRTQQQAVQVSVQIDNLNERIEQIRERLDATEDRQDRLSRDIEELQREIQDSARDQGARVTELSNKLNEMDAARARDRKAIIDQISAKMATVIKQQQKRQAPRFSSGSQTGYEHVVKEGQTLSEIASAYGVKADAIARANKLPDRNNIRVGQKLFIPD